MTSSKTLKVVVAGATGLLGHTIIENLVERGHNINVLTRGSTIFSKSVPLHEERLESMKKKGVSISIIKDITEARSIAESARSADVFINAVSPLPLEMLIKVNDEQKNSNYIAKTEAAKSLAKAASMIGSKVFLHQSIISCVKPNDGSLFDENSTEKDMRFGEFLIGERNVLEVAKCHPSMSTSILRCGLIYGADSIFMQKMAKYLKKNKIPIVGDGLNQLSFVHVEDAANAFVTLAEKQFVNPKLASIYHVVDDDPIAFNDLLTSFAEKIGADAPSRWPIWMVRLVLDSNAMDFVTSSTITTNNKLKKASNWSPRFPSIRSGISQVVDSWRKSKIDFESS